SWVTAVTPSMKLGNSSNWVHWLYAVRTGTSTSIDFSMFALASLSFGCGIKERQRKRCATRGVTAGRALVARYPRAPDPTRTSYRVESTRRNPRASARPEVEAGH